MITLKQVPLDPDYSANGMTAVSNTALGYSSGHADVTAHSEVVLP
jgi:hypothetical protein